MTADEHRLMMVMFNNQAKFSRVLLDILISREILKPDDLDAFEALVVHDTAVLQHLIEQVKDQYLKAASCLQIHTGIEGS
jgi:hypothetical protein